MAPVWFANGENMRHFPATEFLSCRPYPEFLVLPRDSLWKFRPQGSEGGKRIMTQHISKDFQSYYTFLWRFFGENASVLGTLTNFYLYNCPCLGLKINICKVQAYFKQWSYSNIFALCTGKEFGMLCHVCFHGCNTLLLINVKPEDSWQIETYLLNCFPAGNLSVLRSHSIYEELSSYNKMVLLTLSP